MDLRLKYRLFAVILNVFGFVLLYIHRVDFVCAEEGSISWYELIRTIYRVLPKYDVGVEKEHLCNKSHRVVINALSRFEEAIRFEAFLAQ